jgi:hypothetical protein
MRRQLVENGRILERIDEGLKVEILKPLAESDDRKLVIRLTFERTLVFDQGTQAPPAKAGQVCRGEPYLTIV